MIALALVCFAAPAVQLGTIAPGIEVGRFPLPPADIGPAALEVVRIDPSLAVIELGTTAKHGGENRTAGAWADELGATAVINAGMFDRDYRTHVGYLSAGGRVYSGKWVKSYHSVLLFEPKSSTSAAALLVDRDLPGFDRLLAGYHGVNQNLRLIRAPGVNVWSASPKRWSEAALAIDRNGRVLWLFSRSPYTMADFNAALLALPLGIVAAQHLEGGPEASLSIRTATLSRDLAGSFETGFFTKDSNRAQWALPNVLAVRPRK